MFCRFILAIGLWFALALQAQAAIAVNTCGINNGNTGATLALSSTSTGAVDIPAGSIIILAGVDLSTSGSPGGGVVDSASNIYTNITSSLLNNAAASGFISLYYSTTGNALPLTGAGTLTYTRGASGARTAMSCVYITGAAASSPLDTAITAVANGSTGTITVTSGTPGQTGNLYLGWVGNNNNSAFTQDTGNGWSSTGGFAASANASNVRGVGGNQIGNGAKTFAPTLGTQGNWAIAVIGFKPATATTPPSLSLMGVGQ